MSVNLDTFRLPALLSSEWFYGKLSSGNWAAKYFYELDLKNQASFVLLLRRQVAKGKLGATTKFITKMKYHDIRKEPRLSWILYKKIVYIFSAEGRSSLHSETMYAELEMLKLNMVRDRFLWVIHDILAISNSPWDVKLELHLKWGWGWSKVVVFYVI
ncbi:hypothetical protein HanIR_Chr13g0639121 [Helianthus annuus]|nr:hypothetical protein HanIR_Chr13g0639121 [Helianthus annuus]